MEIVSIIEKVGIGGGLVVIMFVVVRYFIKSQEALITLVSNHIQHNTDVLVELKNVIKALVEKK